MKTKYYAVPLIVYVPASEVDETGDCPENHEAVQAIRRFTNIRAIIAEDLQNGEWVEDDENDLPALMLTACPITR